MRSGRNPVLALRYVTPHPLLNDILAKWPVSLLHDRRLLHDLASNYHCDQMDSNVLVMMHANVAIRGMTVACWNNCCKWARISNPWIEWLKLTAYTQSAILPIQRWYTWRGSWCPNWQGEIEQRCSQLFSGFFEHFHLPKAGVERWLS